MGNVKISPDKLLDLTKKITEYHSEYTNTYDKLIRILENNEAKLDKTTQQALLVSCNNMKAKFNVMSQFLKNSIKVTNSIATEFKKINDQSESKIRMIGN